MAISKPLSLLLSLLMLTTYLNVSAGSVKGIFVLAGQSNMAGRGGVGDGKWNRYVPPQCRPNPSILRFTAQLKWEIAREPLHADIDQGKTCGVGPGMAFAHEVRANSLNVGVVGLVPCAIGGTRIRDWARGTGLYNGLVSRVNESLKDGGKPRAILWYQGESDTVRKHDAEAYGGNFKKLIVNLLSDLGIPSLPVIQVAIASGEGQFVETVRKAQLEVNLPNVKCVDAKGLPLKTDHLHLSTTSEVHLGRMLARAFLTSFGRML